MKRKPSTIIIITILALIAAIGVAILTLWAQNINKSNDDGSIVLPKVKIGGAYNLIDHNGKRVTNLDFNGKYQLIYFGYTYCPDVCPTALSSMAEAMAELADKDPELEAKITPIFITIDPDRDDVATMAEYVDNFHPRMIGLTGNLQETTLAAKAYRVFFALGEPDEDGDYPVDHSSFVYFMGPDGIYRTMFRHGANPLEMAKTIKKIIDNEK